MISYRFKAKDVFISSGYLNIVVGVSKDSILTIQKPIDLKGKLSGNWDTMIYKLTEKSTINTLNESQQAALPKTAIAEVGSMVMYGEQIYMYCGNADVALGAMVFDKPYLLNFDGLLEDVEDNFDAVPLQSLLPQNIKQPLESNKNIVVFEVAPAQRAVQIITKIEPNVEEDPKQQASSNLIPILKNTFSGSRGSYINTTLKILQGFTLPYNQDDLYNNGLPYTIVGEGKYRTEQSTWNIFGGAISSGGRGAPTYILSEGEQLFPDWKLTTDSLYPIGTKLRSNKTGEYENSIIFKVIAIEFFDTMFGRFSALSNDKNDAYINHPEIYLGGNKYFAVSQTDLFLLLGKQPLKGTKKDGLDSVWYKPIGSTQFPLKTRKQLESGFTRYPYSSVLEGNLESYQRNDMSPSNYYPKSFKDAIEQKNPQLQLFAGDNFYKNRYSINLSWEAFKLLSDKNINSNSTTSKNEIVEKLMEYFDYNNLNIIKDKNPKLYEKINDLMGKSIKLYIDSLPDKKIAINKSNSIEYFLMYLGRVIIQFYSESSSTNRTTYDLDFDIRQGGNTQMSIFKDTGNEEVNNIFKNYVKLIDDFVANDNHLEQYDFLIPKNRIVQIVQIYVTMCKFAMDKLVEMDYRNVNFEPNIYGSLYVSNFVAAYDYTDAFNRYGEPFFSTLTFGEARNYWSNEKSQYRYNFNFINLEFDFFKDDETKENIKIFRREIQKLHSVVLDNFLLIKRLNHLGNFIEVFKYYDIASKKVDVNFEDITNDIRFKYYLRFANLIGHFQEVDFVNVLKIFETIREVAANTAKFATFVTTGVNFNSIFGGKFEPTLLDFDPTIFDYGNPRRIYEKLIEDGFNVEEYAKVSTTALGIILLEPKLIVQYFKKITDGMKQNTSFKLLLEGSQTPEEMWLRIFGGGDSTVTIEEEEPEVVVETVDEAVNVEEEINWDDVDTDDIDIMLDIDFDEDSIEI